MRAASTWRWLVLAALAGLAALPGVASATSQPPGTASSYLQVVAAPATKVPPPPAMTTARRLRAPRRLGPDVRRIRYSYGPIEVTPGQNWINLGAMTARQKPAVDGYVTRIRPDLVRADGTTPPSDQVMFHHGVWLNASRPDATSPGLPERFFAAGEEKTILTLPRGFGYPTRASDRWVMNDMIHNLVAQPMRLYVSYDIDFVPADSPTGRRMRPVRPIWMDVRNGEAYPVMDIKRGTGSKGRFTYPDDARRPYGDGPPMNEWTVDRDGVLVAASGHLHAGGLRTDLFVDRDAGRPRTRRVFRSEARYFEPRGPVSWDVAMTATRPGWRVRVRRGQRLRTTATYETRHASWYESMGIMVVYMADGRGGADPFARGSRIRTRGKVTHGHLPENDNHGGEPAGYPDARRLRGLAFPSERELRITGFSYGQGDGLRTGRAARPPVIRPGAPLRFRNLEGGFDKRIYHTITSCRAPCNRETGIAYPIPDGRVDFDSGQLGYGPPGLTAAANRITWETPRDLAPGTYTYFCRVHPFMRGAFRVAG